VDLSTLSGIDGNKSLPYVMSWQTILLTFIATVMSCSPLSKIAKDRTKSGRCIAEICYSM
jgi:hypothetical protein